MRDPSEVIAEMRDCERHVQVFGWPRAIRQWADELAATLPASTPPGDAEVLRLRQGYWDARAIMGFDNDGAPTPAARVSDFVAMMLSDARSMRADYDEAIAEQSASVVGLSDDPCVRHACKRVRMEMQARIDALSQRAEVDGAMVDELLAIAEGAEADRADAAIGRIVWKFIDRMNDVCEQDPADRIVAQFVAAVEPLMLAKIDALAGAVTQGEDHG